MDCTSKSTNVTENPSRTPLTFNSYHYENTRYGMRPSIKKGSNECDEQKIFHVPRVMSSSRHQSMTGARVGRLMGRIVHHRDVA
eukprot:scaffold25244_cov37-Cyclotella_meneghiniana.AAC.2